MEADPIKALYQLEFTIDVAGLKESEKTKQKQNLQVLAEVINQWNKLKAEDNGVE